MGLMNRIGAALALAFVAYAFDARPAAQLLNAEAPVRVGHYHLNVTSVEEHRKFWVETLGGTATGFGSSTPFRMMRSCPSRSVTSMLPSGRNARLNG